MATSIGDGEEIVETEMLASSSNCDETATAKSASHNKKPTCVIVLGMAGSGKTTFVQVALLNIARSHKLYRLWVVATGREPDDKFHYYTSANTIANVL